MYKNNFDSNITLKGLIRFYSNLLDKKRIDPKGKAALRLDELRLKNGLKEELKRKSKMK
tara:strand:+ start:451 stop:627 length:177 start_codon:yes stop_codon:yes gene_type:complete